MIVMTTFRFKSPNSRLEMKYMTAQNMLYHSIKIKGKIAIKKSLNIAAFGAKAFISLSIMNQSIDTNDSDDEPTILVTLNMLVMVSG
jgi:hypothetical protein